MLKRVLTPGGTPTDAAAPASPPEPAPAPLAERSFRDAMSLFPTGVTVVAADDGTDAHGLTVASFTSVSLAPPLCLVCIKATSPFLPIAERAGAFSVSVLAAEAEATARLFAQGEAAERLAALTRRPNAPPTLPGALARFDFALDRVAPAGDHAVLFGAPTAIDAGPRELAGPPLTWWRGAFNPLTPKSSDRA